MAASAGADAPPRRKGSETVLKLDVNAAVAYAIKNSPELAVQRAEAAVTEADISAAGQLTNPELRIGRNSNNDVFGGGRQDLAVALRFFPDMPAAVSARVAEARATFGASQADGAVLERTLSALIRRLYVELAFANESAEVLRSQIVVLNKRRQLLTEQMQRGAATRLDVLLADQEMADTQQKLAELEGEDGVAKRELAQTMGLPPGQAWTPIWDSAALQRIQTSFDRKALLDRALANRPELTAAALRSEAAGARAFEERTERLPWFGFVQIEREFRDTGNQWGFSLSLSLPVFSMNSGKIAEADAEQRRYRLERRQLAIKALRDVEAALDAAEATAQRASDAKAMLLPVIEEADRLLNEERVAATEDPAKMLTIEARQVRARRTLLDALREYHLAKVTLEENVGSR